MAGKVKQQALTNNSAQEAAQALGKKTETSGGEYRTKRTPSLSVNGGPPSSGQPTRRQKGGHGYTMELSRDEVRFVCHVCKVMFDQGLPIYLGTIRPPAGFTILRQKRYLCKAKARIGQSVKRKGSPFYCLGVYERPRGRPNLHLHILVIVPTRTVSFALKRWSNDDDIQFKKADPNIGHYLVKERQVSRPDFIRSKREAGDLIPGSRISLTKDLWTLIGPMPKPKRRRTPRNRARDASLRIYHS